MKLRSSYRRNLFPAVTLIPDPVCNKLGEFAFVPGRHADSFGWRRFEYTARLEKVSAREVHVEIMKRRWNDKNRVNRPLPVTHQKDKN